jgi:hypothetical protein
MAMLGSVIPTYLFSSLFYAYFLHHDRYTVDGICDMLWMENGWKMG